MIGGSPVVVLRLTQVRAVVGLAQAGNLEGGSGDLGTLGQGVVDLGPLDGAGPAREKRQDRAVINIYNNKKINE